uniref:Uncharacterized protein n=1 Tax=Arundo donax TaxID=35708 RepID=A0A0A8XWQ6_ARUDO
MLNDNWCCTNILPEIARSSISTGKHVQNSE